jgi:hypothetical protein
MRLDNDIEVGQLAFRLTAHGVKTNQHLILGFTIEGLLDLTLFNLTQMSVSGRKEYLRWVKREEKKKKTMPKKPAIGTVLYFKRRLNEKFG